MTEFARQAGAIALDLIHNSSPGLKKDHSVITQADHAISRLFHEQFSDILSDPKHILIDEEDPRMASYLNHDVLSKVKYLWALDPIDGTRLYANRMPLFGVSLGVLREGKPWLGVVFFPVLKELFYCDGTEAFFVQNAFTEQSISNRIVHVDEELSAKSLFFCNDTFFNKFHWESRDFHIMIHACAIVNLCWPAIGRGVGCFLRSHVWDFVGSWPIIQKAGFDLRRVSDGKVMQSLDVNDYNVTPKPWELKEYYLISTAKNFELIRSKIRANGA